MFTSINAHLGGGRGRSGQGYIYLTEELLDSGLLLNAVVIKYKNIIIYFVLHPSLKFTLCAPTLIHGCSEILVSKGQYFLF